MHLRLIRHATLRLEVGRPPAAGGSDARPRGRPAAGRGHRERPPQPARRAARAARGRRRGRRRGARHAPAPGPLRRHRRPSCCPRTCRCCASPRTPARCASTASPTSAPSTASSRSDGITVLRTPARHGYGADAEALAPVSGFLIRADGASLYVAGDTVLYEDVEAVLDEHRPDVVVVNASGARFTGGEPIVMDLDDVVARRPPRRRARASSPSTSTRSTTACRRAPTCTSGSTTSAWPRRHRARGRRRRPDRLVEAGGGRAVRRDAVGEQPRRARPSRRRSRSRSAASRTRARRRRSRARRTRGCSRRGRRRPSLRRRRAARPARSSRAALKSAHVSPSGAVRGPPRQFVSPSPSASTSAAVRPAHAPTSISRQAGSCRAPPSPSSSAVSRARVRSDTTARDAGMPKRATSGASARACARPVSDRAGSCCPWSRASAFQVDSPCRTRRIRRRRAG